MFSSHLSIFITVCQTWCSYHSLSNRDPELDRMLYMQTQDCQEKGNAPLNLLAMPKVVSTSKAEETMRRLCSRQGTVVCPGIPASPSPCLESWLMCTQISFGQGEYFSFLKTPGHRGKNVCMPSNLLLWGVWSHLVLHILKELLGAAGCAAQSGRWQSLPCTNSTGGVWLRTQGAQTPILTHTAHACGTYMVAVNLIQLRMTNLVCILWSCLWTEQPHWGPD